VFLKYIFQTIKWHLKGDVNMTQTVQPRSGATLNEVEKDVAQTEDNIKLLLSLLDSMNKLSETVNRLNYAVQRQKLEQTLLQEKGGEKK